MTAMAVAGAQWRLPASDRRMLTTQYLPWAVRAGSRCSDLMCIYYENHLEVPAQRLPRTALFIALRCRMCCHQCHIVLSVLPDA
jgi:ubiquinone biosynthesis protein Coq4